MIPFECPYCGLQTRVDPRFAGQSGPCAGCNRLVTVPFTSSPPPAPAPTRHRLPPWLLGGLALSVTLLLLALLSGVLIYLIQPAVRQVRLGVRQAACRSHVAQLVNAMYQYRDDHQRLPPAYSADAQGKPLHSWRVLLLPYLGSQGQALYGQLRLDEPWNSPHNQAWANQVPDAYVCPDDQRFAAGDTSYCVVVGEQYAFRPGTGITAEEITDDPSTTLLVIEVNSSGINWMTPVDVTAVELAQGLNSGVQGSAGSQHTGGGVTVGTADGSSRVLPDPLGPEVLHKMATVSGDESLGDPFSQPR